MSDQVNATIIEATGKAVSTAKSTPVDGVIGLFKGFFGTFSQENPYLTTFLFIALCAFVACVLLSPVWIYFSRQKTKRLKHLQEHKEKLANIRLRAFEFKMQQQGRNSLGAEK
ncbi:hypothetical protein IFO68_17245 [Photobacterium sp. CAU 1568]|uniref:Uncharacterized protein n=1 Tax=Photobacterium arenosum TaxID=2774143 RepID=A0ABR9BQC1_9GAMM|nr:hypothetical protein [Photobacterium arenosum]MBD8514429.1 hypothetical protein [Photobacterium arenosum]